MNYTDLRLKIRHFFRRNAKLLSIIIIIWGLVFLFNLFIANRNIEPTPKTTREVHTSIIDSTKSTPSSMRKPITDMIDEYVSACNDGNYQKAFNMLSDECREFSFNNNINTFMSHVLVKTPTPKEYSIQDYSNITYGKKKIYTYEVKYIDNLLATGLTNSTYNFTTEKFTFYEDKNGDMVMSAGDFVYHSKIQSISENNYLKIDVLDKVVRYSTETYKIRFTNRSNYTIVIADGAEYDEILLALPKETRGRSTTSKLVLKPGDKDVRTYTFPKFVDDGDMSQSILFSSVRVMEKYSGTEDVSDEVIQSEIDNAISKFSMEVKVTE